MVYVYLFRRVPAYIHTQLHMQVQQEQVQSASLTNSSTQAARSITEQELMAVRRSTHTYHQRICIIIAYSHAHFRMTFAPLMRGREIEQSADARFVAEQQQEIRHAVFC